MLADKEPMSFIAGEDLSAADMLVVMRDSDTPGQVVKTSATTDEGIGIIDQGGGATSGHPVRVITGGRAKGIASGILSASIKVAGGSGGKLEAATTSDYPVGVLEEAGAEDGDEVMVFVEPSLVAL